MNDPQTYQDWRDTAMERAADADAMLPRRSESIGPVYMAGYAVECMLKSYLRRTNRAFSTRGQDGHNLQGLWRSAGFRIADLKDKSGGKTFFINNWDTALRYQNTNQELTHPADELVNAAKQLSGWIANQIRRQRRPR
jgi:hypothetical protein